MKLPAVFHGRKSQPPFPAHQVEGVLLTHGYFKHQEKGELVSVLPHLPQTSLLVGHVPGWPGAHTQGADNRELEDNLREVIEMLLEDGEPRLESEFVDLRSIQVA